MIESDETTIIKLVGLVEICSSSKLFHFSILSLFEVQILSKFKELIMTLNFKI